MKVTTLQAEKRMVNARNAVPPGSMLAREERMQREKLIDEIDVSLRLGHKGPPSISWLR